VSAADGSDAHQVTGTGLSYPTLADNGTVYALEPNDNSVDVLPPGAPKLSSVSIPGIGDANLDVSPDGGSIAWQDIRSSPLDPTDLEHEVAIERFSDGRQSDFISDAWAEWFNATQLSDTGPMGGNIYDASKDLTFNTWSFGDVDEFVITRAFDKAAARIDSDFDATTPGILVVFANSNGAPATGGNHCYVDNSNNDPIVFSNLTWSPDGQTLAWQEADGIHEASIGSLQTDCSQVGTSTLVIPGGSEPDWGPSANRSFPEPAAPAPTPPTPTPPGPTPPTPTPHKPTPHKRSPSAGGFHLTSIKVVKRLKASAALKHGIAIRLTVPAKGTLTATATVSKATARKHHVRSRTVARGSTHIRKPGAASIVLRVSRQDAPSLRQAHGVPLTITLQLDALQATIKLTPPLMGAQTEREGPPVFTACPPKAQTKCCALVGTSGGGFHHPSTASR
jgi:hypothetical protein